MIRRSSITLDFANHGKQQTLSKTLDEVKRVTSLFIETLWNLPEIPKKFTTLKTETWLSAALVQICSAKAARVVAEIKKRQAAAAAKSRKNKRQPKKFSVPVCKALCLDLDQRSLKIEAGRNSFDLWIHLRSLGSKAAPIRLDLPSKKHEQFNKFVNDGWTLKKSGRLHVRNGKLVLDVYFEKEAPKLKETGTELGVDIGYRHLIATDDGKFIGSGFDKLARKIQSKRQGSKAFKRSLVERDQFINRAVNELPLEGVKMVARENLKCLKKGRHFHKEFQARFQRWAYPQLIQKLESRCEVGGVHCCAVNPAFTSQTCSRCGYKDKNSRVGESFHCTSCDFRVHSDTNGAVNILTRARQQEHGFPAIKAEGLSYG